MLYIPETSKYGTKTFTHKLILRKNITYELDKN